MSCLTEVRPKCFGCEVCKLAAVVSFEVDACSSVDGKDCLGSAASLEDVHHEQTACADAAAQNEARIQSDAAHELDEDSENDDILQEHLASEQPASHLWGEDEILVWMQVTLQMANSTSCQADGGEVLQKRWQEAR